MHAAEVEICKLYSFELSFARVKLRLLNSGLNYEGDKVGLLLQHTKILKINKKRIYIRMNKLYCLPGVRCDTVLEAVLMRVQWAVFVPGNKKTNATKFVHQFARSGNYELAWCHQARFCICQQNRSHFLKNINSPHFLRASNNLLRGYSRVACWTGNLINTISFHYTEVYIYIWRPK